MYNQHKLLIAKLIEINDIDTQQIYNSILVPPDKKLGDYALPCFPFAKLLKKSPVIIAQELADSLTHKLTPPIQKVVAVNGYLNFFIDRLSTAKDLLQEILSKKYNYGDSTIGNGKTVCIDYSSINIAKPFHIGHLCSTVIGGALYKVYKKLGFNAIGINHLGDWGTQFGKLIVAFKMWGNQQELENKGVNYLNSLYVKYHAVADKDPTLDEKARQYFKKIEDGDKEATNYFNLFKEITLKEVNKTYQRLNIEFDSYDGESFYNDKMQVVFDTLHQKDLLTESDGAVVVDLSKYDMPPCLLKKADGATLYATRDLAAAFYRKNTYDFYKCLYVVAYQQNLHFKQVFKVLELIGVDWDTIHIPFGMVSLEDGVMSTRKGKVILLEDVLNKAVEKALAIIADKNPHLNNKDDIAEMVGVGAVVFSILYNNRIKDIVFSYDKVLSFEGETGPYIQYTNARCNSVLKKSDSPDILNNNDIVCDYSALDNAESLDLIAQLERFSEVLYQIIEKYEPCFLSRYLVELCQSFNRFYYEHRIIDIELPKRKVRLQLAKATHYIIKEGLRLLGITAPNQM